MRLEVQLPKVERRDVARPEVVRLEVQRPEIERRNVARPEVERLEVQLPEVERRDVARPEVVRLEVQRRDVVRPEVEQLEVQRPEVERRDVARADVRSAGRRGIVRVLHAGQLRQLVEIANAVVEAETPSLVAGQRVEPARQPVREQRERGHHQQKDGRAVLGVRANSASLPRRRDAGAILGVLVNATCDAQQTQQSRSLQQTSRHHRLTSHQPQRGSHRPRTPPRCCHLGSYFRRPKRSLVRPLA